MAHSKNFTLDQIDKLENSNNYRYKEVSDAVHIDLYDDINKIPFDTIDEFLQANLTNN